MKHRHNAIERIFYIMGKFLDNLNNGIAKIHSEAEITQGVTNQVTNEVQAQVAPIQDAIADLQVAVTAIVDHLTAGNVDAATSAAASLQTAVDAAAAAVDAPDRSANVGVTDKPDTQTDSDKTEAKA